jgi:hypothetical protein
MSESPARTGPTPTGPGIAPGVVEPVLAILRSSSAPIRRRKLLEELERRGHRISLAGLNRILQQCRDHGVTEESDDGIRIHRKPG